MDSNSSESNNKIPSGLIDKLQFGVDNDQPMVETSDVEKSLSSEAYAEQSIENNSVRFPTSRDEQREGSKSTPTLKSPARAAEGEVAPTTDDSSKQSTSTSPMVPDGGGRGGESSDNEKARRSSLENKTTLKPSSSVGTSLVNLVNEATGAKANDSSSMMMDEAWERLRLSFAYSQNKPAGTLAIVDPSAEALNYNQVFVRDCVPTALACLMRVPDPEPEIVKRLLLKTLHLQGWKKPVDNFTHGEGVVRGGVTPVDSGFWWIILLWSYTKRTGDYNLLEKPEVQKEMKLILKLCLSDEFDTSPTLLCADGCTMIDRRMGIHGYPIEIQALFFFALRCVQEMLEQDTDSNGLLLEQIKRRITALSYHIRKYYWLDFTKLNNIYRNKTEEYSHTTVNEFMLLTGGYFIGNVTPKHMDFRWFLMGNCIAILSSLATLAQTAAIMDLVEERWEDLIGEMPLKIVYPALEGDEWRIVTGCDHKNTSWSYQNAGSWPVLLWLLTAACIKAGRPQIAKMAIELVEQRLSKDGWPEYYDGKNGRYVGKQERKYQTPSISGYLVAKLMIENPSNLAMISLEEEKKIESDMPYITSIDLQMEILKLLPAKTLVGFLSISKDFKSIIKSPRFIAVQTRLRHTRPQHLLAVNSDPIDGITHCICFVDNEAFPGDRYIPSTPPSPPLDFPFYRKNIIGSSHGTIALGGGSKTVTLWNPSIRRTISVFVPDTTCVTFGVCPSTLEVKIIKISWREKIAMVYTLSTRQWRNTTIGLPSTPTTNKHRSIVPTSVVTDHFCYWQAFLNCNHTIISFDLTHEIFEEILLPTSLAKGGFKTCKIDGSLGMTQFQQQETVVHVWKLEHGVDIAISMLYTLETPNLLVGFPRNGGHILIEEDGEEELLVYRSGSAGGNQILMNSTLWFHYSLCSFVDTLLLIDQDDAVGY